MNQITNLKMREVAEVEALTGLSITALADNKAPQGRALAAIAYIIKKRENPAFTFDDALDLDFEEIQTLLGLGENDPLENG